MGSTTTTATCVVPWVAAYYPAKFQIEPLDPPANVSAPEVEQRVAVRQGSGLLLDFPIRAVVAASISLVDERGEPLRWAAGPRNRQRPARQRRLGRPGLFRRIAKRQPATAWSPRRPGLPGTLRLDTQTHRQPVGPLTCSAPSEIRHEPPLPSACLLGFAHLRQPLLLAACTTSSGTGNFGSLGSFTVASTARTITGTTGFSAPAACCRSSAPTPSTRPSPAPPIRWAPRRGCTMPPAAPTCPTASAKDNGCGTVYNVGSTRALETAPPSSASSACSTPPTAACRCTCAPPPG